MSSAVMMERIAETSPRVKARTAGFFWLMTFLTGGFAMFVGGRFVVSGDAAATAANILAHESSFRLGIASNLIATALTYSFANLLSPPLARYLTPYIMAPGMLGEASLTLWLLVFGVNSKRWNEQAGAADWRSQRAMLPPYRSSIAK